MGIGAYESKLQQTRAGGGGFDCRRFQAEQPAALKRSPSEKGGGPYISGPNPVFGDQKRTKTGGRNGIGKVWIGKWNGGRMFAGKDKGSSTCRAR